MKNKFTTIKQLVFCLSLLIVPFSYGQDNALNFDGVNDYVNLDPVSASLAGLTAFTVELWIKPDVIQQEQYSSIFAINRATGDLNRLVIRFGGPIEGPNTSDKIVVNVPVGQTNNVLVGNIGVLDGVCHHVAYVYNNGVSKLYIDGTLEGTMNYPYTIQSNDRFSLGQEYDEPIYTISQLYTGEMDKLRIWNSEKSIAEIQQLMNQTIVGNEPGLIHLYNFDQGVPAGNNTSISNVINSVNPNFNGTLVNFARNGLTSNFVNSECIQQTPQSMQASFDTTVNILCNGSGCNYQGPSILINELMISPSAYDGSISGFGGVGDGRGEWIELYNPNLCEPIDISCYYLGNNTSEGNGGFRIPSGTIVPPGGFCMVRGQNMSPVPANLLYANGGNVVEVVVPYNINDPGVCSNGTRVWFPNAGGWFAFYDANGVPQDAVSWINSAGVSGQPCVPSLTGCNSAPSLNSYDNIPANRKNYIGSGAVVLDYSYRRIPDGGAWSGNGTPTYADCNSTCIPPMTSTCAGIATINVTGGTAPYTYAWDDSEAQVTQTAIGLCAGTYTCTVTDAGGITQAFQVEIDDLVPDVSVSIQDEVCVDGAAVTAVGAPQPTGSATGVYSGTGFTGATINPATAGQGQYTVTYTYTDENGCHNSATDQITVNPLPVVAITNVASPYCVEVQNANLQLSPAGGQLSGTGVAGNQFSPATAGVGSYNLTYEYTDGNGCENSTGVAVQVVEAAEPTITAPDDLCIDAAAVTIQVAPTGGQLQVNGTNASFSFLPETYGDGSHTLDYSYVDANGCIGSTTETINVHDLPIIVMSLDPVYCYESGFSPVAPQPSGGTFSGDNVVNGGINITNVAPGTYAVHYEVTDAFGCYNERDDSYTVSTPITPGFNYAVDCFQKFDGNATPVNNAYQYNWNIDGTSINAGPIYTQLFQEAGTYPLMLTITDQHGCQYDTLGAIVIPPGVSPSDFVVPNVITPNGDGVNDYLAMPVLLDECFTYKILIMNRWGNIVYEMHNVTSVFDGRNKNGHELTEGVYFYQVVSDDFDCEDPAMKGFCSGFITIVR
ncbi:MAG: gliding motility-associated C-terminal domain-containing protein [Crocinitomicaceae bacterium]|nr:gliding motility-associated C-terminal domain-containing protein [Crocinitomicaceae bacterium]